jgi:hypothetical protein
VAGQRAEHRRGVTASLQRHLAGGRRSCPHPCGPRPGGDRGCCARRGHVGGCAHPRPPDVIEPLFEQQYGMGGAAGSQHARRPDRSSRRPRSSCSGGTARARDARRTWSETWRE